MHEVDPTLGEGGDLNSLAEIIEKVVAERESQIAFLESDNYFSRYVDNVDSSIRPRMAELYRQEIEMFRALSLEIITPEEVKSIEAAFRLRREALFPKI
jgi:hypothetical protein